MTPEEAIQVADEALLDHTGSRLTHIQRMILCESLAGKGYEQMKGYDAQHIKNEGSDLWQLLSQALGEKVSKKNFKGALEKRLKLGDIVPKPPMPSSYNQQTWVGRESLISNLLPNLLPKLQRQTRLLWITGISGIGKTTLGECLAVKAWEIDPAFQWIYLEVLQGQSPDFPSVAADLLVRLGDRDLDPQERNNPDQLARRLLQKLQSHPYWIQLDALERLLKPEHSTEFVDPYWATLLQRCLTEPAFTSRLILTSQAFPNALVELDDRYSNVWAEIRLEGLLQVEQQLEFFAKRGIAVDAANQNILARIAKIYEGHPLVLKVIAEDILKEGAGDVACYWQIYQPEFEQVARELQQAVRRNETDYNEALDRKVRDRIRKSLEQLPTDALDLLCRSAVFRRPVPKSFWLATIGDRSSKQQKSAYRTLDDRTLIEQEGIHQNQHLIRQHNLIRDIAYDLLLQNSATWETAERQAAELWLTTYEPALDVTSLEKVRGYLEAFHHLCEVEDWGAAVKILETNNVPDNISPLWLWLHLSGCYQEQISLLNRILSKVSPQLKIGYLEYLCETYSAIGEISKSIECCNTALHIIQNVQDFSEESNILLILGDSYELLGDYEKALACYKQVQQYSLKGEEIQIMRALVGQISVSICKAQSIYPDVLKSAITNELSPKSLDDIVQIYEEADGFLSDVNKLDQEIRKVEKQWVQELDEGELKEIIGNSDQIDLWLKSLDVFNKLGWRSEEINVLMILGHLYRHEEENFKAIESFQLALEIIESIDRFADKVRVLKNLAELHQKTGSVDLAKQYCDRALELAIELGIPLAEECRSLQAELNKEVNYGESRKD